MFRCFKNKKASSLFACFFVFFCSVFGFSCGIEEYVYLDQVTDIVRENTTRAIINTPNLVNGGSTYNYNVTIDFPSYTYPNIKVIVTGTPPTGAAFFEDYVIYYKIYKSDSSTLSIPTETERLAVNTTMNTEYKNIAPYTDIESTSTSSPDSIFTSKHFFTLRADTSGNLLRTDPNGAWTLKPDAYFISSDDLRTEPPTSVMNYDVAETTPSSANKVSTYASMYIMQTQFDANTLTSIYSKPAFINIFKLPDPFTIVNVTSIVILNSSGIEVNSAYTIALANGGTIEEQLSAKVLPDNASNKTVTWSITDNNPTLTGAVVATIDSSGKVTGTANGTAKVRAENSAETISATCNISVLGF